jgi:hypothetical protein
LNAAKTIKAGGNLFGHSNDQMATKKSAVKGSKTFNATKIAREKEFFRIVKEKSTSAVIKSVCEKAPLADGLRTDYKFYDTFVTFQKQDREIYRLLFNEMLICYANNRVSLRGKSIVHANVYSIYFES